MLLPYAERALDAVSDVLQKTDPPTDFTMGGVFIAVLYIRNVHSNRPDQEARELAAPRKLQRPGGALGRGVGFEGLYKSASGRW